MKIIRILCFSICLFVSASAWTFTHLTPIPYYGANFYQKVQNGVHDKDMILMLRYILKNQHQRVKGGLDTIGPCDKNKGSCYSQKSMSYSSARDYLMGVLHLSGRAPNYAVKDVYCEKFYTHEDFPSKPYPQPGQAPNDKILNVEHTWPQSRFSSRENGGVQKSDLHHLFPSDNEMNRWRGNMKFGDVQESNPRAHLPCPTAKLGMTADHTGDHFEPPKEHKGNVARALFYFSVRYDITIDPDEESYLRRWHIADPVDDFERERHEGIYKIQNNRNPFIDYPELVDQIVDF